MSFLSKNVIQCIIHYWSQKFIKVDISDDIIILCANFYNVFSNHVEFLFEETCNVCDTGYDIHIVFLQNMYTQLTLKFTKILVTNLNNADNFIHYVADLAKYTLNVNYIMDIWPLNGIIKKKQFIKNTLKGELKYLNHLNELIEVYKDSYFAEKSGLKIVVLDLKDKIVNYQNKQTISQHEIELGNFFHSNYKTKIKKNAKKQLAIYELIREKFDVNYILKEGSLKHDLLYTAGIFNEEQITYFNTNNGGKDLCQLCELVMNGFKTLYDVTVYKNNKICSTFHPRDYLMHIPSLLNEENKNKSMITINQIKDIECMEKRNINIGLITFYPQNYINVYSKNKPYYQCLSRFNKFQLQHDVFDDFSNITCIQIEKSIASIDDELLPIHTMFTQTRET